MIDLIRQFADLIWESLLGVLCYPLAPKQRLYLPYVLTSIALALFVFVRRQATESHVEDSRSSLRRLRRFLFPAEVWRHRSTWVDIWYFVPHQMVRIWIYTVATAFLATAVMRWTLQGLSYLGVDVATPVVAPGAAALAAYTVISILIVDFVSFFVHYLQHKVPLLWRFHKIHHSAEVLNPLTNYREHPVDNLLYASTFAIAIGGIAGLFGGLLHIQPRAIQILEISIFAFAFNTLGYHLRHSHIWLRWPGPLACIFGCPAHHQIHHSCKPEHINTNMAFMFPVWDIIFGTYYLPQKPEELKFGIGDGTEGRYRGFLTIYLLPFVELFRRDAADAGTATVPPACAGNCSKSPRDDQLNREEDR